MKPLLFCIAVALAPWPALAHKVVAAVYPAGASVEGEIGFSNGDMAAHQTVSVFGPDGAPLGEAVTDADGVFVFTPTQPVAHVFRADLGSGHVAEMTLSAEEVAAILGAPVAAPPSVSSEAGTSEPGPPGDAQRALIAQMLRDELRPLRRELVALREHRDLQSILGGIGYIAGLFGLGFYLAARRRLGG